jgi:hypothetical protein
MTKRLAPDYSRNALYQYYRIIGIKNNKPDSLGLALQQLMFIHVSSWPDLVDSHFFGFIIHFMDNPPASHLATV